MPSLQTSAAFALGSADVFGDVNVLLGTSGGVEVSEPQRDQTGFAGPRYTGSFRRWPRGPAKKSPASRRPSATGSGPDDVSCGGVVKLIRLRSGAR